MKAWSASILSVALVFSLARCGGTSESAEETEAVPQFDSLSASPTPKKTDSIAIVGAGPAGLTAAQTLKDLGYSNVTVFEKEAAVGGKVLTYYGGPRPFELGAVWASPDYQVTLGFAQKYGVPTAAYSTNMLIRADDGNDYTFQQFLFSKYTPQQIGASIQAYAALMKKYAINGSSGFAGLPAELRLPFSEFAEKFGITPLADLLKGFLIGCGYGYYENVPAMYYLKLMDFTLKIGPNGELQQTPMAVFPNGYQDLWKHVAAPLNVRLSSEVTHIERAKSGPAKIALTVNGEVQNFSRLILATAPSAVAKMLDVTTSEKSVFDVIKYDRYFVTVAAASNLVGNRSVFPYASTRPDQIGHINVWGNRDASSPLFVAYQIASPTQTPEQITGFLSQDMLSYGGATVSQVVLRKEWASYFPHVEKSALDNGFYEKLEALQGTMGTYYVGSLMNFETVEHTARYARDLVTKKFPQ